MVIDSRRCLIKGTIAPEEVSPQAPVNGCGKDKVAFAPFKLSATLPSVSGLYFDAFRQIPSEVFADRERVDLARYATYADDLIAFRHAGEHCVRGLTGAAYARTDA